MKCYEDDNFEESKEMRPAWRAQEQEFGCAYCYDNKTKQDIEIYFFDRANNMRICVFCPYCGRKILEEN